MATAVRLVPCTTSDTSVIKNTVLKINLALGTSAARVIIAKIMGTAPFRPTQDTNNLSLEGMRRKGARHRKTLKGRVTRISATLMSKPGTMIGINSLGLTSKPSVRNMTN
ncbi:MAG: hypothetical protein BWY72_02332 [Bacteroidetes bacterium ADurb.Bin416]|nr:MAG: hypothetical protein BWY72_02332 [Bacteroidetes bacterium ADurb.Bin416]